MVDQAEKLRELMQERKLAVLPEDETSAPPSAGRAGRTIAITSGKGGVGKTNITANLAIQMARRRHKVIVLDADFGLANIDVLLGLTPRWNISHVFAGRKTLEEVMVDGPCGIRIPPQARHTQLRNNAIHVDGKAVADESSGEVP